MESSIHLHQYKRNLKNSRIFTLKHQQQQTRLFFACLKQSPQYKQNINSNDSNEIK